jgi:hypothetical protein
MPASFAFLALGEKISTSLNGAGRPNPRVYIKLSKVVVLLGDMLSPVTQLHDNYQYRFVADKYLGGSWMNDLIN